MQRFPQLPRLLPALWLLALAACQSSGDGDSTGSEFLASHQPRPGQLLELASGARLQPGDYVLPAQGPGGSSGAVRIVGARDTTLDLTDVHLRGTAPGTELDRNEGYGIVLENCENVVVQGGKLGGYRVCLVLRNCRNVTLQQIEFESWYGKRLLSTTSSENQTDWIYPHENDNGQWMANYGGAIAAEDCQVNPGAW